MYVAATRARDVLIVPKAGTVAPSKFVCGDLLADLPEDIALRTTVEVEPYVESQLPGWARLDGASPKPALVDGARLEAETTAWWTAHSVEAARSRWRPASITGEAHKEDAPADWRAGRFGIEFGTTVHMAIATLLGDPDIALADVVARAAKRAHLTTHLDEAAADVIRAIEAIREAGLAREAGATLEVEYPIAAAQPGGILLSGYIDFVRVDDSRLDVLDFKTDSPPAGPVERDYPAYVVQVRTYARLLADAGIAAGRALRCGLLFTGDGGIRWVDVNAPRPAA